jgi:hypothetical protein
MGDVYLTSDEVTALLKLFDNLDEDAKTLAAESGPAAEAAREIAANVAVMRDVVEQASRAAEQ